MSLDPYNEPRPASDVHLLLTPSESRVWAQYQITPTTKATGEALGLKPNTVSRMLLTIREKLDAQKS